MRVRIELETTSDINGFCAAISNVNSDVYLVDSTQRFKVSAKSILGLMLAKIEWSDGIYCECEEDIYTLIEKWVARSSNVSVHE